MQGSDQRRLSYRWLAFRSATNDIYRKSYDPGLPLRLHPSPNVCNRALISAKILLNEDCHY